MGFSESVQIVLSSLTNEQRSKVLSNVFIQGGNSLVPGFIERVEAEIVMLSKGEKVQVHTRPDRQNEAWKGAARLAQNKLSEIVISKKDYEEKGMHYREHAHSNKLYGV